MAVGDHGWQGGIQYISNIMGALNAVAHEDPVEINLFKHSEQHFADLDKLENIDIKILNTENVFEPWSFSNRVKWFAQRKWMNRINPRMENFMLRSGYDYVFPATLSDCNHTLNAGSWIADFQYKHFPDGADKSVNADADRVISTIAERTSKIILSSKFCENDCHHFFPASAGKTHVMPFAVAFDKNIFGFTDFASVREKYSLPQKFLVVSNLFAPTKNHKTLFQAIGILKQKGMEINIACTGNIVDYRNQGYANEILQTLTSNKIRSQAHLLGLIPRADQLALSRMSVAMVQPSLNEGWNTSVEEAKSLGKKIILSSIEVHREQNPDKAYFFEPLNVEDMAEKIRQAWEDSGSVQYPVIDEEQQAFAAYQEKLRAFGRRFLEIARFE